MNVNRRTFLRGAALAPVAAPFLAEGAKVAMLKGVDAEEMALPGLKQDWGAHYASWRNGLAWETPGFPWTDFASWLANEKRTMEDETFEGFAADLLELNLPLHTKIRMQKGRQYKNWLEDRRSWFEKKLADKLSGEKVGETISEHYDKLTV